MVFINFKVGNNAWQIHLIIDMTYYQYRTLGTPVKHSS